MSQLTGGCLGIFLLSNRVSTWHMVLSIGRSKSLGDTQLTVQAWKYNTRQQEKPGPWLHTFTSQPDLPKLKGTTVPLTLTGDMPGRGRLSPSSLKQLWLIVFQSSGAFLLTDNNLCTYGERYIVI
jgi:hypothetical protein